MSDHQQQGGYQQEQQHAPAELGHEGQNRYNHTEMANQFEQAAQQENGQSQEADASQQAGWAAYANSPAHPNQLPSNVISAYANSFYDQQHQHDHQHDQQTQSHEHAQSGDDDQAHSNEQQQHQQQLDSLIAASGEYDQTGGMYASEADASAVGADADVSQMQSEQGDLSYDGQPSRKKSKTGGSGRVAKACQPCSSKKRRCDGGRPECSVCKVLGTTCSYNNTGLKRGPPKGFRSGPKESAKAKLTRVLETTIRDLFTQLGPDEANKEVSRVARERGLGTLLGSDAQASLEALGFTGTEFGVTQKAIQQSLAQGDDAFLGVNERGDLLHRGSSSGIQLLRRNAGPQTPTTPSATSPDQNQANKDAGGPSPVVVPIPSSGSAQPFSRMPRVDSGLGQTNGGVEDESNAYPILDGLTGFNDPEVTPEESQKLFDNYWRTFHPYWPILYKAVLDEIPANEVASRLDGLLLNAIYAIASSERGNNSDPQAEGIDRHSGELFAQAAERRLYASGLRPTVSAIQGSFMLSVFSHENGDLSRAWTFCGIAITMAMDLGLHRWPIHRLDLLSNVAERETRTRSIWNIYVLDKILCAEMGRAPILRAREMDPPLLSVQAPDELEYLDDVARPMRIPSVFNACVHLFTIVERILTEVHSLRRKAVLRQGQDTPDVLNELDAELEKWKQNLPDYCTLPTDPAKVQVGFAGSICALWVWESTATILLHRPFIPQGTDDGPPTQEEVVNNPSHQKAITAANRLCDLLNLDSSSGNGEGGAALWPSDYAYCLFTAAVMYLFDARIGIDGARQRFAISRDQLRRLSSRWPAASAHKQLLDGFTAVADDALGRPDNRTGENTTLSSSDAEAIQAWAAQAGAAGNGDPDNVNANLPHIKIDGDEAASGNVEGGHTTAPADAPQRNLDSLTEEQRQQLLSFYMDSTHRFGPSDDFTRSRRLDSFAPGLFDVETAFWNEAAGSSNLSSAFTSSNAGYGSQQQQQQQQQSQQQQQQSSDGGSGQAHHGLAMLAALAPHAAPQQVQQQQQQQQQHDANENVQDDRGRQQQHQSSQEQQQQQQQPPHLAVYQPIQQQLQAALQQTSPFAFSSDPGQPAWNDPLMSAMNLGPRSQQQQQQQQQQQYRQ